MLESIYIGMTGLSGYSKGLRVIANNTANMNTPGFKSSTLQFSNLFYGGGQSGGLNYSRGQYGFGLNTNGVSLNFKPGELRQTGNDLDLAMNGQGMFILKDTEGNYHYTRAGQFQFNDEGFLVDRTTGNKVMTFDTNGNLVEMNVSAMKVNAGKTSSTIKFNGNLLTSEGTKTVSGVTVYDSAGGQHSLSMKFTSNTNNGTTPGNWDIELFDGTTSVGKSKIVFTNGRLDPAAAKISMTYSPTGAAPMPLTLDFSGDVTSFASGNLSTMSFLSQDGYGPSTLTQTTFDNLGTLVLTYANGQTVKGNKLALGRFNALSDVTPDGNNMFDAVDQAQWQIGSAGSGAFGQVSGKMIEVSNVDLSEEFSNLIVMQRGYQASSQIISTANDMLQELFSMKGK